MYAALIMENYELFEEEKQEQQEQEKQEKTLKELAMALAQLKGDVKDEEGKKIVNELVNMFRDRKKFEGTAASLFTARQMRKIVNKLQNVNDEEKQQIIAALAKLENTKNVKGAEVFAYLLGSVEAIKNAPEFFAKLAEDAKNIAKELDIPKDKEVTLLLKVKDDSIVVAKVKGADVPNLPRQVSVSEPVANVIKKIKQMAITVKNGELVHVKLGGIVKRAWANVKRLFDKIANLIVEKILKGKVWILDLVSITMSIVTAVIIAKSKGIAIKPWTITFWKAVIKAAMTLPKIMRVAVFAVFAAGLFALAKQGYKMVARLASFLKSKVKREAKK